MPDQDNQTIQTIPAAVATEPQSQPQSMKDAVFSALDEAVPATPAAPTESAPEEQPTDEANKPMDKPMDKPADKPADQPTEAAEPLDEGKLLEGVTAPNARERIQQLVTRNKETEAKLAEAESVAAYAEDLQGWMDNHQIAPDDMQILLQLGAGLSAGFRGDAKAAAEVQKMLMRMQQQLVIVTGETVDIPDPLADYPDLQAKVNGLQMAPELALEVVRSRQATAWAEAEAKARKVQAENQRQIDQNVNAFKTWGTQMRNSDPDASWKLKEIQEALVEGIVNTLPQAQAMYKRLGGLRPQSVTKPATPSAMPSATAGALGGGERAQSLRQSILSAL
jgi:tryptophan 2,3-dioxygenase